jgi:putative ABC transport system ATP-binding protein
MNNRKLISINNLSYFYNNGSKKVIALSDISLAVEKGDFLAITGASGSGKSTLAHIMGCLLKPTVGTYFLNGMDTTRLNNDRLAEIRNDLFGFVFQAFNLLPKVSTLQNVRLPHRYSGISTEESIETSRALLVKLGLESRMNHMPNELSGGEQQRVAIARALVNRPKIIIADEPTGNLDSHNCNLIMNIFKDLVDDGLTVIFVTHDRSLVHYANKTITLADSKIVDC